MTAKDAKQTAKKARPTKRQKAKRRPKRGWLSAAASDPHVLYEKSVQDPEGEIDFIYQVWDERRRRKPITLREDFCGTAIVSCAWVRRKRRNSAVAVDIDGAVLEWGRGRLPDRLAPSQHARLHLVRGNVLTVRTPPVDTVVALNFSYFLFKTRDELRRYFKRAYASLARDGIFIVDAYGGSESFEELEEERDCDGFTYVWDQHSYNPITGDALNYIHFRFPDGTEMNRAFQYDWRLWTLPEIQEVMTEAGFRDVAVYWEGTDKRTKEGDGEFARATRGEACAGWVAYIVGEKRG